MQVGSVELHSLALPYICLDPPDVHLVRSNLYETSHSDVKNRCRGLKILVDLLDEDYSEQADLIVHALNGIGSVFELQSPTTKNDFCRMFIREGLLDPLSSALLNVMANRGPTATDMKLKIIQILLVFSQVSQSDIHVRNALGSRKVVRRLLRACELLEPECLVHMLKAVKHLSMNANVLDVLQNANAIEILVRILDEQSTGPHSTVRSLICLLFRVLIGVAGNVKPYFPNLLQSVSVEQVPSRRSCSSWDYTMPQTDH